MHMFVPTAIATALAAAGLGLAAMPASAAVQPSGCVSPPGLNYMICNGQRVPKPGNRVVNPDGSWREEVRQGSCLVVKEKTASGEYKETRQCN